MPGEPASPFPTLRTPRLCLREILPSDAPALLAIHGDAHAMRWFGTDPLPDLDAALQLVHTFASWRTQANPGVRWAICTRESDALLGTCGLFAWNRQWRKCGIGYELHPGVRGRGYMREALTAAIAWGFEHMALNRIEAQIHPDNAASSALAQRLGFQAEGRLRQVAFWGQQFHDLTQWGLLRDDWLASC